jgi:alkylation response protein AidB-like acyl-CoA dehydrogenase
LDVPRIPDETAKLLLENVREFCSEAIAPIAEKIDEEDRIPDQLYVRMRDQGLLTLLLPEKYGGLGLDYTTYSQVIELVTGFSAGVALSLEAHNSLGLAHLVSYGSEELKRRVIPEIVSGASPVAWALTEPRGGSDARGMETVARKDGDRYLLNGTKTFITHGARAKYLVVMAKFGEGISSFLVDGRSEGLRKSELEGKLGVRGSDTATLVFEDVVVPNDMVIGEQGRGFEQAMDVLDGGRIAVGAMGVGTASSCLEISVSYAKQRSAFGSPISQFQGIRFLLAELATGVQASRLLVQNAAALRDSGLPHRKEAAMAKYFSSQVAVEASRTALQIMGGYGYFRGSRVERIYRDAKILEIGEGTNEVLKSIIARETIGG